MKILLYDIETAPNLGYIWGKYEQNVIDFKDEWHILCFAYKWLGESKINSFAIPDFKCKDDEKLVKELWKLFDEADVVIGHNSKKFDDKKATARFIYHKLNPPSPYKQVDTLQAIKRVASFNSHKLDDLGKLLGEGKKIKTDFGLWLGCLNNDKKCWQKMISYNKQDVKLLERIYLRILPYIKAHPNYGIYEDKVVCPRCGSEEIHYRGYYQNNTTKYRRFRCKNCGGWSRTTKNMQETKLQVSI